MIIAKSLSARRAWIEIKRSALTRWACTVALRKESVDRNGHVVNHDVHHVKSLSARRAWIEITALHTALNPLRRVALRKESVDRNRAELEIVGEQAVALRKESVDRNDPCIFHLSHPQQSLSARRAWIEIVRAGRKKWGLKVALRKESVDRNWPFCCWAGRRGVALRKESVDRNV